MSEHMMMRELTEDQLFQVVGGGGKKKQHHTGGSGGGGGGGGLTLTIYNPIEIYTENSNSNTNTNTATSSSTSTATGGNALASLGPITIFIPT